MASGSELKLHVGSGPLVREGWVNIDSHAYPGVDHVLDVRGGLPFDDASATYVYAEHFIEHLPQADGLAFLRECRRVLKDNGILRLSTPSLDWVWATQYHLGTWGAESEAIRDCFWINRGFYGWGHQFLYNFPTLRSMLKLAGFADVVQHPYGASDHEDLRGLEKHETYHDTPELPHIVIVEASGRGEDLAAPEFLERMQEFQIAYNDK